MSRCRNIAEHLYFTNVRSILTYVFIVLVYCFAINPTADAGQNKLQTNKLKIYYSGTQPGHYLEWQNKPILLIGDSVTQGWMECGGNFNYKAYVDALSSRGINLLTLWSYIATNAKGQRSDSRIGYDAPEIWPWPGSPDHRDFDLTRFNQTYFDRLKSLVGYAEKKGVVVLITIHDGWTKRRFNRHPFNISLGNGPLTRKTQYVQLANYMNEMPAAFDSSWSRREKNQYFQERFCDKLIVELNPYSNVIYEMFNEGEWYNLRQRRRHEQHFLAFFRTRCDNLLLTNTDHIFGDDPHSDNKVDVVTMHGGWKGRFDDFQMGFNRSPTKPYVLSEPVPAFSGDTRQLTSLRRMLWEVAMAGGGWVNQNDTSFAWDPKTEMASKTSARDKAYDYVGYCAWFFNRSGVNFSDMKPQGGLSSTGICMAQGGMEYAVYAPGGTFTVDLSKTTGPLRVDWYNPRTGQITAAGSTTGGALRSFTAPDTQDWVLHIKGTGSTVEKQLLPPIKKISHH